MNPAACDEAAWTKPLSSTANRFAVIGAGPAGLNAALTLLRAGKTVEIFEKSEILGGQFNLAALIPGKAEYQKSIIYWEKEIKRLGGVIHLNHAITSVDELSGFDEVVVSSGVTPRKPKIPGIDLPHVIPYDRYLREKMKPEGPIAVIGAGGIGVDVSTYILHHDEHLDDNPKKFFKHWGIDTNARSGLDPNFKPEKSPIQITILQRKPGQIGKGLGKTTGWIHRLELKRSGVQYLNDLDYEKITPEGLWVKFTSGESRLIPAKQIIVCAGQESENALVPILEQKGIRYSLIGGAKLAGELDAKRAIREAWMVGK